MTCCKARAAPPPQPSRLSEADWIICETDKHWTAVSVSEDSAQMSPRELFSAITKQEHTEHRKWPHQASFFNFYFWFQESWTHFLLMSGDWTCLVRGFATLAVQLEQPPHPLIHILAVPSHPLSSSPRPQTGERENDWHLIYSEGERVQTCVLCCCLQHVSLLWFHWRGGVNYHLGVYFFCFQGERL